MSSINNKEKNFISAVVYLHNDGTRAVEFCRAVAAELDSHFAQYELVVVDDACTDDTVERLRTWGKDQAAPLTILHMSIYHGLEDAMNAGLDAAIGDYVYEFDSTELCYAPTLIMQAYRAALDGSDIVSVCPRTVRGGSSLFYKVFNAHSQSAYRLRTAGLPASGADGLSAGVHLGGRCAAGRRADVPRGQPYHSRAVAGRV